MSLKRQNRLWTGSDDMELTALFQAGANLSDIANQLNRTEFDCETRMYKLGLKLDARLFNPYDPIWWKLRLS